MAVALATSLQFIRAEGFVFSHVADEGLVTTACAGDLLRYREGPLTVFKAVLIRTSSSTEGLRGPLSIAFLGFNDLNEPV